MTEYRHASGELAFACFACIEDDQAGEDGWPVVCTDARPDPDDPEVCETCSHTVEEVSQTRSA